MNPYQIFGRNVVFPPALPQTDLRGSHASPQFPCFDIPKRTQTDAHRKTSHRYIINPHALKVFRVFYHPGLSDNDGND